jgi:hypothetical protein
MVDDDTEFLAVAAVGSVVSAGTLAAAAATPLGPLGVIFLLILCGLVLGFRGKLVEIGLISICLVF